MPVESSDHLVVVVPPGLDRVRQRFAGLTWLTALYGCLLVIFGGLIWSEWLDRVLVMGLVIPITVVGWSALRNRGHPGFGGPGGATRPALLAVPLLVVLGVARARLDQLVSVLGTMHSITAFLLLAALVVASVRARGPGVGPEDPFTVRRLSQSATGALVLGFIVVSFGVLTANLGGGGAQLEPGAAALACKGFPLCDGQLIPKGDATGMVHIHWVHRMTAYLLFFHLIGAAGAAFRRRSSTRVQWAAVTSLVLVVIQVTVAAILVLYDHPGSMRILHLAVGTVLWMTLVLWATAARQDAARLDQEIG